ncbi:hypothetical protein MFRU_016g01180 [Monilinia fructicola]|uniref:Fork-head domain-containing protein n=1 Tax=Monilinia fructicola TaxID=38448 RepID=A0A5M9JSE3_MONFR|nr:hypothetical protein EYC84_001614 [Monilinia fructicola]KAG4029364.1 hypothetical protein MFRU_016g01180 [Monilinia fructicola]
MTSSKTAETVTQPVAPVATMSTTTFSTDNNPLSTHMNDPQDNAKLFFPEQDKSITAAMDTTLPSNSTQQLAPLPENTNPSAAKGFDSAKETEKPELSNHSDIKVSPHPEEPIDSVMEDYHPKIEQDSNGKEAVDPNPEINTHSNVEPTTQLIQKHSQSPPNRPLDTVPLCDQSNVLPGTDQSLSSNYQDACQPNTGDIDPEDMFRGMCGNNEPMAPDFKGRTWMPEHMNLANSGVQLDGFAKLLFDDSTFYMTTHEVIIGRDTVAQNNLLRYEKEQALIERAWNESGLGPDGSSQTAIDSNMPRQTIININPRAGILESWMSLHNEKRSRKGKKLKNQTSQIGTGARLPAANGNMPLQNPDPHSCPVVRVHPPFDKGLAGFKAISREHVRIFYDDHQDIFKVEFLGRNGGFVDGVFYEPKQIATLKSGSKLQLGFIYVTFALPDLVIDDTSFQYQDEVQEEAASGTIYSEGGKEMSLSFDDVPRAGDQRSTDNSECSSDYRNGYNVTELSDNEEENIDGGSILDFAGNSDNGLQDLEDEDNSLHDLEHEEEKSIQEEPLVNQPIDTSPQPAKKRGPGRPPKNGVMSKREQQIAKKEALERERIQEEERAQEEQKVEDQVQGTASKTVPGKNKVGRPRKHPRPEVAEEGPPRQKRKYTKRQSGPKSPASPDEDKFDDDGNCIQAKSGSTRKVAYTLKEVSRNKEDYTAERLEKPHRNYLQLVYELLEEAARPLCLPQIYNEMEVKFPYFLFQDSKGWQSSVRHNLGQHECFERTKRAGKGWAWTLKPGSSYMKEKKKKERSPPVAGGNQPIYQAGHPIPGYGVNQMQPPPGYMFNPQLYQSQMNPHQQQEHPQYQQGQPYMGHPNHHYAPYPMHQGYVPPPGIPAPFLPPMVPQLGGTAPASYSSPYAPKPSAATAQPQGTQQQPQGTQQPQGAQQPQTTQQPQGVQQLQAAQQPQPQQLQPPQHQYPQQQYSQQYPQQPHYQPQGLPQHPNVSQSQVPQHQSRPSVGNSIQAPPQAVPQTATALSHQKRVIPPNLIAVVQGYRNHVVNLMRQKAPQSDAEALVDKAINRVYDGTEEDRSLDSTEHEMKLINGVLNVLKLPLVPRAPSANPGHTQQQQQQQQQQPQPAPQQPSQSSNNQNKPQGSISQQPVRPTGLDVPKQTIMRPSFYGNNQNPPSGSSVPRPPLMTPGLQRSNSISTQNAPVRPNTSSSSSTPGNSSNLPPQAAVSNSNKIGSAASTATNTINQTTAQVEQNVPNNGLKVGETLTEAGFVRSFPQPQIST